MLINAIIYTFSIEDADRAVGLLRELRDAARAEAGCVRFEVGRSVNDPNVFTLFEEYVDQAALDAHLASEAFNKYGINGIRKLAKDRVGHTCRPID
jgi:quinol monooxygenase YgiN